jgi:hypothetical protein
VDQVLVEMAELGIQTQVKAQQQLILEVAVEEVVMEPWRLLVRQELQVLLFLN